MCNDDENEDIDDEDDISQLPSILDRGNKE